MRSNDRFSRVISRLFTVSVVAIAAVGAAVGCSSSPDEATGNASSAAGAVPTVDPNGGDDPTCAVLPQLKTRGCYEHVTGYAVTRPSTGCPVIDVPSLHATWTPGGPGGNYLEPRLDGAVCIYSFFDLKDRVTGAMVASPILSSILCDAMPVKNVAYILPPYTPVLPPGSCPYTKSATTVAPSAPRGTIRPEARGGSGSGGGITSGSGGGGVNRAPNECSWKSNDGIEHGCDVCLQ